MPDLPDELPVRERDVVRLLVLDNQDRLLLFHSRDPTYPELGTWWELPGGGIEGGETVVDTAVRELREETGIEVRSSQVHPTGWHRVATFRYRGTRHLQHESVLVVRLTESGPSVDGSLREGYEDEDYFDYRWRPVAEIAASSERFYPGRLAEHLVPALAGTPIAEPFEHWS